MAHISTKNVTVGQHMQSTIMARNSLDIIRVGMAHELDRNRPGVEHDREENILNELFS
jgi:hypothetical protein